MFTAAAALCNAATALQLLLLLTAAVNPSAHAVAAVAQYSISVISSNNMQAAVPSPAAVLMTIAALAVLKMASPQPASAVACTIAVDAVLVIVTAVNIIRSSIECRLVAVVTTAASAVAVITAFASVVSQHCQLLLIMLHALFECFLFILASERRCLEVNEADRAAVTAAAAVHEIRCANIAMSNAVIEVHHSKRAPQAMTSGFSELSNRTAAKTVADPRGDDVAITVGIGHRLMAAAVNVAVAAVIAAVATCRKQARKT